MKELKSIKRKLNEELETVEELTKFLKDDAFQILYGHNTKFEREMELAKTILYEGRIERYKPGFGKDLFISRWVQVTPKSILIFKDELQASCFEVKPMLTIPIHIVRHVERVRAFVKNAKSRQY